MSAATFSLRFRVSFPSGGMVPPGLFVSQRVFDEGGPLQYKAVVHPSGGGEVVIRAMASGVRMEVGAPATWVVSVMHDITDTEHLERMRDQFFAAAAHSLKTPLAIIKADVQALQPAESPDAAAASPHRSSASAIEWTAWSRTCWSWRGRASKRWSCTRARWSCGRSSSTSRARRSGRTGTSSSTEVTGSPSLHADPERLALAIRNLLYEASRLSPADSCLTLLARPEGDQVAVGVRYQPLPWRDQVERGLRRVRRHRHRALGGADDRRGTRRIAERGSQRLRADELDPSARRCGSARVTPCNDVLVVDDDEDMIEVIELVLHDAGYATRTAMNGQQALDAVARSMPALIVLDMLMPVMNGWQFAREFRARYGPGVPIVVATAAEHVRQPRRRDRRRRRAAQAVRGQRSLASGRASRPGAAPAAPVL